MIFPMNPNAQTEVEKRELLDNAGICSTPAEYALKQLGEEAVRAPVVDGQHVPMGQVVPRPNLGTVVNINTHRTNLKFGEKY